MWVWIYVADNATKNRVALILMSGEMNIASVDYIIVGGGSAGCVLAARLSENANCQVMLIEAGGEDRNPMIHIPAGYIKTMVKPSINWMFESEAEASTAGRHLSLIHI